MDKFEAIMAMGGGAAGLGLGTATVHGSRLGTRHRWRSAAKVLTWATAGWVVLASYNALLRRGWVGYSLAAIEAGAAIVSASMAGISWEAAARRRRPPRWDGRGDYP